ncbi:MAG: hypothetical protein EG825_11395 [Rhodocyclaceae bacterium]|nr:hypothetical protein [Rhodocyclaceae bacterium]
MVLIVGGVFMVLGILSGVILLAAPFGLGPATPGMVTWAGFPLLCTVGYVALALGRRSIPVAKFATATRVMGTLLLLLALAAIIVIFLAGNDLLGPVIGTVSFYYVAIVGFFIGGVGLSLGRMMEEE